MNLYKKFKEKVEAAGLEPRSCSNYHWQIFGGAHLVNYYPELLTVYVANTATAWRGTVDHAIRAASEGISVTWSQEYLEWKGG